MPRPQPIVPGPGQESVWDYPRPPRVDRCISPVRIVFADETIALTSRALRVLETSHPPTYYIPAADITPGALHPSRRRPTVCEWKGIALALDVRAAGEVAQDAAWTYPKPSAGYEMLAEHVAFYCALMDECWVGDELAAPQPGHFYGGWVTSSVVGPFKGMPGSHGW
jgi:uncharacterized protein (DUF427 family)